MSHFKSVAWPEESLGVSYLGIPEQVVPNQSMSLEEILLRFTRGEALPISQQVEYGSEGDNPLNVDLEKLAVADLVDKEEFAKKLHEIQSEFTKQQKERDIKVAKEANLKAQADMEKRLKLKLKREALAKEKLEKSA